MSSVSAATLRRIKFACEGLGAPHKVGEGRCRLGYGHSKRTFGGQCFTKQQLLQASPNVVHKLNIPDELFAELTQEYTGKDVDAWTAICLGIDNLKNAIMPVPTPTLPLAVPSMTAREFELSIFSRKLLMEPSNMPLSELLSKQKRECLHVHPDKGGNAAAFIEVKNLHNKQLLIFCRTNNIPHPYAEEANVKREAYTKALIAPQMEHRNEGLFYMKCVNSKDYVTRTGSSNFLYETYFGFISACGTNRPDTDLTFYVSQEIGRKVGGKSRREQIFIHPLGHKFVYMMCKVIAEERRRISNLDSVDGKVYSKIDKEGLEKLQPEYFVNGGYITYLMQYNRNDKDKFDLDDDWDSFASVNRMFNPLAAACGYNYKDAVDIAAFRTLLQPYIDAFNKAGRTAINAPLPAPSKTILKSAVIKTREDMDAHVDNLYKACEQTVLTAPEMVVEDKERAREITVEDRVKD